MIYGNGNMNPLDYTLYTLNAKQLLIDPESKLPPQRKRGAGTRNYGYLVSFIIGILLGQLIKFI
jgi:hypothetical protein